MRVCSEEAVNHSRHRIAAIALATMLMIGRGDRALSMDNSAMEPIASACESKLFILKVDLHEPETGGESMQVPTLEKKGWHHHNPSGRIALKAGTRVEVTGVFNYADRGLVLELAKEEAGSASQPISSRPRCRIRIMVEKLPADPAGQVQEAAELIEKVLEAAAAP